MATARDIYERRAAAAAVARVTSSAAAVRCAMSSSLNFEGLMTKAYRRWIFILEQRRGNNFCAHAGFRFCLGNVERTEKCVLTVHVHLFCVVQPHVSHWPTALLAGRRVSTPSCRSRVVVSGHARFSLLHIP